MCPVPSAALASLALKPSTYRYLTGHCLVFFTGELRGKQNISHNPSLSKVGNKRQTERGPRVSRNIGELVSLCGSEDHSSVAQRVASIYYISSTGLLECPSTIGILVCDPALTLLFLLPTQSRISFSNHSPCAHSAHLSFPFSFKATLCLFKPD